MDLAETHTSCEQATTSSKKRRLRRKKSLQLKNQQVTKSDATLIFNKQELSNAIPDNSNLQIENKVINSTMSSKDTHHKSREEVLAAREAKKQAKQKTKAGGDIISKPSQDSKANVAIEDNKPPTNTIPTKSKDEVDRAIVQKDNEIASEKSKEQIKAERAAKKQAKQAKKKGTTEETSEITEPHSSVENKEISKKVVAETISDITEIAKEVQDITAKVNAFILKAKAIDKGPKPEEQGKSKAELKAERRAKQEAQRAAKAAQQANKTKPETAPAAGKPVASVVVPKDKFDGHTHVATRSHRQSGRNYSHPQLNLQLAELCLVVISLHPAIIKLGVQLATRVVSGSNARCIALLDALKKMVRDFVTPARSEFGRGLEAALAAALRHVGAARVVSASQLNAVAHLRRHLTRLPNNVTEFHAKKILQEEIDRYIREQIDMAGEAISLAVREKISHGDNILTYGYSSLIERILREAHESGLTFSTVVVGCPSRASGREMLRRLARAGLPCAYADITALSHVMKTVNKVLLGADSLMANGSVLGAAGTAQVALAARDANVPTLVCCETHKFSSRVQTDAFVFNELGNPDDLMDKEDEDSPLKDWRNNPLLTPLNLTFDVTPASLVTAVVTELAILPCTSAPVVLRFKLSDYGI